MDIGVFESPSAGVLCYYTHTSKIKSTGLH